MSDAFDVLAADTAPIQPSRQFADGLRRQLINELEIPVTIAATDPATATTDTLDVTNTVTPYLIVNGAAAAIDFYVAAFGAVEHHRMVGDDGRVGHAEIVIGGSRLMMADEYPEIGALSPATRGGTSVNFTITVPDVDQVFARALQLGATELRPVEDQFYGHRQGTLADPFGHQWSLSTPIAGFTEQQYVEQSAAGGFEVVRAEQPANEAVGVADVRHQVKPHGRGDLFYFTLPTTDLARAQAFFGAVLGWQFMSPDNGHVENIAAPPGGLNQSADVGARLWFVVDDIDAAVAKVRELGGTSTDPVLYDSGWSAECTDDQGTVFSLSVPAAKYTI
jgi:uncharacterized glyoxalase superfamily protein PhnB/predicted enzyme related to lactoylglutathione lyase